MTTPTPTALWQQQAANLLPPLPGAAGIAERLLLLLHFSIDWDNSWVAGYRTTYWDKILPDRVLVVSRRAQNLRAWWTALADDIKVAPATDEIRLEVAQLLDVDTTQQREVLRCLREETIALVLRTRIVAEQRRANRLQHRPTRGAA